MAKKEPSSTSRREASVNPGQSDRVGDASQPTPEEGRRLIDAFFKIKHPALREAVISLVAELSNAYQK
jgi:hypothetical protein